jgi:hypothetical protein
MKQERTVKDSNSNIYLQPVMRAYIYTLYNLKKNLAHSLAEDRAVLGQF